MLVPSTTRRETKQRAAARPPLSSVSHLSSPAHPPFALPPDSHSLLECPCENGGTCAGNTCQCLSGYSGSSCEELTDCYAVIARIYLSDGVLTDPCQNGGTCVEISDNASECECLLAYEGSACEVEVSPCEKLAPCQNGASCADLPDGYTCTCAPGFSGETCQDAIPACSSTPCLNGGSCAEAGPGAFTCTCPSAFTGATCETEVNECLSSPCQNGATCVNLLDSFSCTCASGFYGPRCESGTPATVASCSSTCLTNTARHAHVPLSLLYVSVPHPSMSIQLRLVPRGYAKRLYAVQWRSLPARGPMCGHLPCRLYYRSLRHQYGDARGENVRRCVPANVSAA